MKDRNGFWPPPEGERLDKLYGPAPLLTGRAVIPPACGHTPAVAESLCDYYDLGLTTF